ncbi:MAG: hypothetical protein H6937_07110 [Burkholderiales bacterium]|nr:hypothetical protein [Burkholderiales bacterium]MCP5245711.1 hypothetical protein [Burkholderiales bacterium]
MESLYAVALIATLLVGICGVVALCVHVYFLCAVLLRRCLTGFDMEKLLPTVKEAIEYLNKCHTPQYVDDCIAFWVGKGAASGFEESVRAGLKKK